MAANNGGLVRGPSRSGWRLLLPDLYGLSVGLLGLGALGYFVAGGEKLEWLPILVFAALSLVTQRSSFHLGTPIVHSLAGVIDLSAVITLGPVDGGVVAATSGLVYLGLSALRHRRWSYRNFIGWPIFNAGLKAGMALLSGSLFEALTGPLPLGQPEQVSLHVLTGDQFLSICAVSLLWFGLDHLGWSILDYLEGGWERLRTFVRHAYPHAFYIELLPLPFSLVLATVYTALGWLAFLTTALFVVVVAILAQRWARTRNELMHRVAELSTIEQIGRTIAQAQLDVDELCHLMYDFVQQLTDATIFHLGLFEGDQYTLKLWMRKGEAMPSQTFQMTPGVGLVNWMRDSKRPLLVRDFNREIDSLPAQPIRALPEDPPRSALYVPLIAGETVIGIMSVQSFRPNAYGESELRILSAMANQAALALQKAQMYAQERKRAQQLEIIGQVTRQVMATLELDELFPRIVHLIRESFGYYHVAVYTADRGRRIVTFEASASAGGQTVTVEVKWGEGLIGWVAAHGEPVMVNDVEHDTRYRCVEALEETRSELAVPLLLEGELVGVLDVQSDQLNAFGPDDLFILETLGGQIALAIHRARLYEMEQQQAWLSTALLQVAESASRLSDLDEVLTSIVRLVPLLAGVQRCALLLWDAERETFIPSQSYGLAPECREAFERLELPRPSTPALELVRLDRRPLVLHVARDRTLLPEKLIEALHCLEIVLLPLIAQGEFLGIMMVCDIEQGHASSKRMLPLLTGITNQAATVIQNARLVQAQREEAYLSLALLQVAEAVSRAAELDEALSAIVRITPMLVGVEACAFLLWDAEAKAFLPVQQYGLKGDDQVAFWRLRWTPDQSPMQDLLAGQPWVSIRAWYPEPFAPQSEDASTPPTLLALPLRSRGEVVGAMLVACDAATSPLPTRRMNILNGIAGQAALAVESARLLQEAAERERMQQELEVARRIQSSFLPEACPPFPGWDLAALWCSARQVSGDFYDFIPLPPASGSPPESGGRLGLIIADVADKGVPAALFMALSRTLIRTMAIDGRPPAAAIARANDLILADARSELFVTVFYAILQPHSGDVSYVNAGHLPPLWVHAEDGRVEELRTHDMALAVLPGIAFTEQQVHLAVGDLLVLYTDGVTDASNADGEMLGRQRLAEIISAHRSQSAEELVHTIDEFVNNFVGNIPQYDDITVVVAKRKS